MMAIAGVIMAGKPQIVVRKNAQAIVTAKAYAIVKLEFADAIRVMVVTIAPTEYAPSIAVVEGNVTRKQPLVSAMLPGKEKDVTRSDAPKCAVVMGTAIWLLASVPVLMDGVEKHVSSGLAQTTVLGTETVTQKRANAIV